MSRKEMIEELFLAGCQPVFRKQIKKQSRIECKECTDFTNSIPHSYHFCVSGFSYLITRLTTQTLSIIVKKHYKIFQEMAKISKEKQPNATVVDFLDFFGGDKDPFQAICGNKEWIERLQTLAITAEEKEREEERETLLNNSPTDTDSLIDALE